MYGVRSGYWFEAVPWVGLAGDLSHFEAKGDDVRFRVMGTENSGGLLPKTGEYS